MQEIKAILRNLDVAPRKARIIADLIRNRPALEVKAELSLRRERAVKPMLKLLDSAIANAKNLGFKPEKLAIKEIRVDGGQILKRWLPRAQGRATPIQKKRSHIFMRLEESAKIKPAKFVFAEKSGKEASKKTAAKPAKPAKKTKAPAETAEKTTGLEEPKDKAGLVRRVIRRKSI
ncbi:MAG: 50S ribosomal protein L22 [Patescibacteria group bacterium]|nr:50S ribosomal protein L22 [Patescibacteria group bacterium]MCL5261711.1 50S ribosomal protein L22 [Patescibacteria group bacterium]